MTTSSFVSLSIKIFKKNPSSFEIHLIISLVSFWSNKHIPRMQVCRAAISARTISSCLEILGAKGWNSNILKKYPVHHFLPKLTAPMCLQHPFCCDNKFPCIYWKNFLSLWVTSNTHSPQSLSLFYFSFYPSIPSVHSSSSDNIIWLWIFN